LNVLSFAAVRFSFAEAHRMTRFFHIGSFCQSMIDEETKEAKEGKQIFFSSFSMVHVR
jgi:hypothetical protein